MMNSLKVETTMATVENEPSKTLKFMFEEALANFNETENGVPTLQQDLIKNTIKQLEDATNLINVAQIFSTNEMLEEVATENIQYLSIPAMLGVLVTKLQSDDRVSTLETAEIYFKDFLTRGKEYGLVPEKTQINYLDMKPTDFSKMALDRNEKIERFKEQKQLQSDLVELKKNLDRADDDIRRDYYKKFVKGFIFVAEEELKSIAKEKPLAEKMKTDKEINKKPSKAPPQKFEPLKPVIITKNELQKKVFGAGYPSLPIMTVDEFYEDRVKQGIFPANGSNHVKSLQEMSDPQVAEKMDEEEATKKEKQIEEDDPESLQRARNMDDYKDDHRRGWGNRMNRS